MRQGRGHKRGVRNESLRFINEGVSALCDQRTIWESGLTQAASITVETAWGHQLSKAFRGDFFLVGICEEKGKYLKHQMVHLDEMWMSNNNISYRWKAAYVQFEWTNVSSKSSWMSIWEAVGNIYSPTEHSVCRTFPRESNLESADFISRVNW